MALSKRSWRLQLSVQAETAPESHLAADELKARGSLIRSPSWRLPFAHLVVKECVFVRPLLMSEHCSSVAKAITGFPKGLSSFSFPLWTCSPFPKQIHSLTTTWYKCDRSCDRLSITLFCCGAVQNI